MLTKEMLLKPVYHISDLIHWQTLRGHCRLQSVYPFLAYQIKIYIKTFLGMQNL